MTVAREMLRTTACADACLDKQTVAELRRCMTVDLRLLAA